MTFVILGGDPIELVSMVNETACYAAQGAVLGKAGFLGRSRHRAVDEQGASNAGPFARSGATLMACEQTDRLARLQPRDAIEFASHYHEITITSDGAHWSVPAPADSPPDTPSPPENKPARQELGSAP